MGIPKLYVAWYMYYARSFNQLRTCAYTFGSLGTPFQFQYLVSSLANLNIWVEVKFKKILKNHWNHTLSPTNLHLAKYGQTIVCIPLILHMSLFVTYIDTEVKSKLVQCMKWSIRLWTCVEILCMNILKQSQTSHLGKTHSYQVKRNGASIYLK